MTPQINTKTAVICGQKYPVVRIGKQLWMAENMKSKEHTKGESWEEKYGRSYNWDAAMSLNLTGGWHLPTDEEWTVLIDNLGGRDVAGAKMKSTEGWDDNGNGTNESGLNILPGGYRYSSGGSFFNVGGWTYFWSATEYNSSYAWNRRMGYSYATVYRDYYNKTFGFSVRCMRDLTAEECAELDNLSIPTISGNCKEIKRDSKGKFVSTKNNINMETTEHKEEFQSEEKDNIIKNLKKQIEELNEERSNNNSLFLRIHSENTQIKKELELYKVLCKAQADLINAKLIS